MGREITGMRKKDKLVRQWNRRDRKYHDKVVNRVFANLSSIGAEGDVVFKLKEVRLRSHIEICREKGHHDMLSLTKEGDRYVFTLGEAKIGQRSFGRGIYQLTIGLNELKGYWKNYVSDYKEYVSDGNIILDTSRNYEVWCRSVLFSEDIFSPETNGIKIYSQRERKLGNLYDAIRG